MFEIFIQGCLGGVDSSGFEKKMQELKLQEEARKNFGIDEFEGGTSSTLRKKFKTTKSTKAAWTGTLRKFKRETANSSSTPVIGAPTLVSATSDRKDGAVVAPQVPVKLTTLPGFTIPNRPLPVPTGARPFKSAGSSIQFNRQSRTIPQQYNAQESEAAATGAFKRNTWRPQTNPVDFSNQVNAAGAGVGTGPSNKVRPSPRRLQGRPLPRPTSVRPHI